MATVAELQIMKITSANDGTDSHAGVRGFSYRRSRKAYYNYRAEGALAASRQEQIASDDAPVAGQLFGLGATFDVLSGQSFNSFTLAAVDPADGSSVTITITNVKFSEFSGGGNETRPDNSSIGFEATAIAFS